MPDDYDPEITPELYLRWRNPRRGTGSPERMDNPVWAWLIRSEVSSYLANEHFGGPSSIAAGPCWSWDRFGQSSTELPDGRTVFVAGEHEDSYDPDFCIYNDVVVRYPDGRIEIRGYREDAFPPTDFHSATLVGEELVLIGSLGYPAARRPGETQVLRLDTATWTIRELATTGEGPGWIHSHRARLTEDGSAIDIEGGKVDAGRADKGLLENLECWRLHLDDRRWKRLTQRNWPQWEVLRASRQVNLLFEMRSVAWNKDMGLPLYREHSRLLEERGGGGSDELCFDASLLASLYEPAVEHETLPERDGEHGVYRNRVDGVVVRFVEDLYSVTVTVEGHLPPEKVTALVEELRDKLTRLEDTPYEAVQRAP